MFRSLFVKDWANFFWILRDDVLYIYRSRSELWPFWFLESFMMYEWIINHILYCRQDSEPVSMREPKRKYYISNDMRVLNIKIKSYSKLGEIHNFMLEEVKDYGPVNVGKFGSPQRREVEMLWLALRDAIAAKRSNSVGFGRWLFFWCLFVDRLYIHSSWYIPGISCSWCIYHELICT